MSITISLYQNNSSPETLSKSISAVTSVSGNIKERTSIVDPVILFEFSSLPSFNYVYIPAFNRYYYVTNITCVSNELWEVSMHVDVLMSYKAKILNCTGVCNRQENVGNMYIPDPLRITENDDFVLTKDIGSYFTTSNYILITQ